MKNYVITGSIGHIGKPIVEGLVKAVKNVKVITSTPERKAEIEKLGATALVGSVQGEDFVKQAFKGADAVYTMVPPIWQTSDWRASMNEVGKNYAEAIKSSGVKYVVNLSSIGAHAGNGVGPVDGLHDVEKLFNAIPGINIKHLRPAFFFYNFYAQIPLIEQAGILGANYGEKGKLFLVHTRDIAAVALEELMALNFIGNSVRYIIGDERSGNEIAQALGQSIGKPLTWVEFTDEQQKQGLLQAGLPETHAQGYTDMGRALREGKMQEDAVRNKPAFASTKLEDFAREFGEAFKAKSVVSNA
jgi:uncharacterized protein YbjT (DUF2867 family)